MLSRRPVIIRGPYASEQSVVDHCNDAMLSEVDVQAREAFRVADHVASASSGSWNKSVAAREGARVPGSGVSYDFYFCHCKFTTF